jgi:Fe-S-cluster containining protein
MPPYASLVSEPAPLPCVTCHATCCSYTVPITALDTVRLQTDLRRSAVEFTTLTDRDPDRVGFRLQPGGPRLRIVLAKQTTGELRDWCTFFRAGGSAGGCSVYSARPMPCRMFPAVLSCGRIELRVPAPCPGGAWGPGTALWGDSWRANAERTVTEQLLDFVVNVAWNRVVCAGSAVDAARGAEPGAAQLADDYVAYLDWVGAIYRSLDRHTGCLDRRGPIDPAAIAAAKSLLIRSS